MAIEKKALLNESAEDIFYVGENIVMTQQKTWKFAAVAADKTLVRGTPVGFNDSTEEAVEWMAPDPTVLEIDTDGATGGTFGITVDGIVIANTVLAYNATAALVAATILAETGVVASVTLDTGVYTITFDAEPQVISLPTVAGDVTALTGAGGSEAATATAGTATLGAHKIKGFVWPEPIEVLAAGEVMGVVMVEGWIDYPALEGLVAAGDVTALKEACRTELLPRGINVQNLSQVR